MLEVTRSPDPLHFPQRALLACLGMSLQQLFPNAGCCVCTLAVRMALAARPHLRSLSKQTGLGTVLFKGLTGNCLHADWPPQMHATCACPPFNQALAVIGVSHWFPRGTSMA